MPCPKSAVGLVDANAFYCSCFAAFDASLANRPVVVLSNNDGNVIARSPLAKKLGIQMGQPYFEISRLVAKNNVAVFSSNHGFFAEMSQRFQSLLYQYSPLVEHYSIDECWIDLQPTSRCTLADIGREIHRRVFALSGIPVAVGIATTKTLSKVALHYAKTSAKTRGVLDLTGSRYLDQALERLPVGDIWNVGPRRAELLNRHEIFSALDLCKADDCQVRDWLTIVGLRTKHELQGIQCYPINPEPPKRKMATCSRSFGVATESLADMRAAVALFSSIAAAKLRREQLLAGKLTVWLCTDRFKDNLPQYGNSLNLSVSPLSNCTLELSHLALRGLERIFRPGYSYKKAGVSLSELEPEASAPHRLWEDERYISLRKLMQAVDYINARFGRDVVRCGLYPSSNLWRTKARFDAPGYTTCWEDLLISY